MVNVYCLINSLCLVKLDVYHSDKESRGGVHSSADNFNYDSQFHFDGDESLHLQSEATRASYWQILEVSTLNSGQYDDTVLWARSSGINE